MSSKTQELLDAIDAHLIATTVIGEVLEGIGSFFVLRTAADSPPEYGSMTPVLIVSPISETGTEIMIPPIATQKVLQVSFSIYTEAGGDTTTDEASQLIDLIETVFRQKVFGIASWFDFISKNYSQVSTAPFSGEWSGVAEYICQYTYIDMISGCDPDSF